MLNRTHSLKHFVCLVGLHIYDFLNLLISCPYSRLTAMASFFTKAHSALITVFCRHLFHIHLPKILFNIFHPSQSWPSHSSASVLLFIILRYTSTVHSRYMSHPFLRFVPSVSQNVQIYIQCLQFLIRTCSQFPSYVTSP